MGEPFGLMTPVGSATGVRFAGCGFRDVTVVEAYAAPDLCSELDTVLVAILQQSAARASNQA